MSRKTEEIKLRVTSIEKDWWQTMAADENTSVSELIRRVMNQRVSYTRGDEPTIKPEDRMGYLPTEPQTSNPAAITQGWYAPNAAPPEPSGPVGTSGEVGAKDSRRLGKCACGKPSYIYCRSCRA